MLTRRNFLSLIATIPFLSTIVRSEPKIQHWSDCATHNEPAYPAGPCDCFHVGARIENNHGWKATVTDTTDTGVKFKFDKPVHFETDPDMGGEIPFEGFKNWRRI